MVSQSHRLALRPATHADAHRQTGRQLEGGFTLIELLVVLIIVGVLAAAVTVNLDIRNTGKSVRNEALRIALLMRTASDTAIYGRQQLGIRFHPESYEFYVLAEVEAKSEDGDSPPKSKAKSVAIWQPIDDQALAMREADVPIEFEVEIEGVPIVLETLEEERETLSGTDAEPLKPHVLLLSNGEIMPDFRVVVTDSEEGEYRHQVYSGEEEPFVVEPVE